MWLVPTPHVFMGRKVGHLDHEERLYFCHLTEEEKNFKFQQKKIKYDYLSIFFKEEYFKDNIFVIPTNHLIWFKRNILNEIRKKCSGGNIVCPHDKICDGHKFIDFFEMCFSSIAFAVEEKKVFYNYFYFKNIEYKNNGEIFSWDATPAEPKDLRHLSYSKRLAYLN